MRKTLVLSWTVPPETSGSAVIVGNLAKQFRPAEMVLAGERPTARPPVAWREDWPRIYYLGRSVPPHWRGQRWWRRLQLPWMLLRTCKLLRQEGCSAILSIFPKEEHLLVGYLASLVTGAAFYPYFHNVYLENRKGSARLFAEWLQPRVFRRARHVFVMSDGMLELYRKRYPGLNCSVLAHSFPEVLPAFAPPPPVHDPLQVMFAGTVNDFCRDALTRASEAIRARPGTELTLLSGTPERDLKSWGLLDDGTRLATVSRDEVIPRLQTADIVLLPHGLEGPHAEEEYQTIFPTKTIEYLICGRPILAHAPPGSYITRFLRDSGAAIVVDSPDVDELKVAIGKLQTDSSLRMTLIRNALKAAERFQAAEVAANLRARLNGHT